MTANLPEQAVEAAARALDPDAFEVPSRGYGESARQQAAEEARAAAQEALTAALPHLTPTVDRDTIDRKLSEVLWNASNHPSPVAVLGKSIDPLRTKCVDAVMAAIPGPTVAEARAQVLEDAANDVFDTAIPAEVAHWLRARAARERGGRP